MFTIVIFFILATSLVGGFGLLGIAAAKWGVDSRPTIGDDHAR